MSDQGSPTDLLHAVLNLRSSDEAQHVAVVPAELEPQLAVLRQWQSERLSQTYADMLADDRSRPLCQFFMSDIYAARDFSQRDHDAERIYGLLSRYLPAYMLELLADAIRITRLTNLLDCELLDALVHELGMVDRLTPQMYAQAYRICNNYTERKYQIDLLVKILDEIGEGGRNSLVGITLRLARGPAHHLGWFEVYDFLERGYAALRHIRDIRPFRDAILKREMAILDRIFAGDPNPFNV